MSISKNGESSLQSNSKWTKPYMKFKSKQYLDKLGKMIWNNKGLLFIFFLSTALVWTGLKFASMIFDDYMSTHQKSAHFADDAKLSDLGNVISGTTGVLFTLAGIVLLAYTLYQTHKELDETQTILKNQLVESTFFNLLKNHKEVILNPDRKAMFESTVELVKEKLLEYRVYENLGSFPNFSSTKYSPIELYKHHKDLRIVGQSIVHIANLIERKLEDKEFYHKTFYYNLSENEMFLFGLIIDNKLDSTLMDYRFYYREEYNKFGFRNSGLNLPGMELKSNKQNLYFSKLERSAFTDNILTHGTGFNIIGKPNEIILHNVEYDYRFFDETKDPPELCDSGDRFWIENYRLNFMTLFNQTLFGVFNRSGKVVLDFTFVFSAGDYKYCVKYKDFAMYCKEKAPTGSDSEEDIDLGHFCRIQNVDKAFHISIPAF